MADLLSLSPAPYRYPREKYQCNSLQEPASSWQVFYFICCWQTSYLKINCKPCPSLYSLHSKTGWLYSWLRLFSNKSTAIVILSCCVLSILLGILIAVEAINKEMCRSFKQREIAIFVILFSVANNTLCNLGSNQSYPSDPVLSL